MPKPASVTTTPALPTVYKTRQMFAVEEKRDGQDIRLILIDRYNELGSQAAVARELGVSQPTIDDWFKGLGIVIETKTIARLAGPEAIAA
jgi:hypothetical protein